MTPPPEEAYFIPGIKNPPPLPGDDGY